MRIVLMPLPSTMRFLNKLYLRLSWLSIDVVFGSMAGLAFFSELFQIGLEMEIYVLLGLAVWSIYTADHLVDARKKPMGNLSPRHQFHLKHKIGLIVFLILSILFGLYLALQTFGWGNEMMYSLILGILIFGSMALVRLAGEALAWLKELSIAVFYVLGIAWIPLLRGEELDRNLYTWAFIFLYIFLALINLLILSYLDRDQDRISGFPSSAQLILPMRLVEIIRKITFGFILFCLFAFILFPSFYRPFACLLLLMGLVHYLAFFNPRLNPEQVRLRMEAAFLIPFLLLIF